MNVNSIKFIKYLITFLISSLSLGHAVLVKAYPSQNNILNNTIGLQIFKSPGLAIKRQDINIGLDQIKVNYIFINNSALDLIETMVFILPSNVTTAIPEEPLQHYKVSANGRNINYKTLVKPISFTGEDLYNFFKSLGISADPIEAMAQISSQYSSFSTVKKILLQRDLIDPHTNKAKWLAHTYFYWQQKFPPAEEVQIQQSYKPQVLTYKHDHQTTEIDAHLSQFCPNKQDLESLSQYFSNQASQHKPIISKALNFNLTYDQNWSAPIEQFTLKIEHPEQMLALMCWPETIHKINSNTMLYQAKNYAPLQDIKLLLVNKKSLQ